MAGLVVTSFSFSQNRLIEKERHEKLQAFTGSVQDDQAKTLSEKVTANKNVVSVSVRETNNEG